MCRQFERLAASLLLFVLLCISLGACAQTNKASADLAQRESYAYLLTMDKINKLGEVRKALSEWTDVNEQSLKRMGDDKSLAEGTFAERAKAFDSKYPEAARIIREHGISTREYFLANHVLVQAVLAALAKKNGDIQNNSKSDAGLNPANLAYVEQHLEEIRKSMLEGTRFRM
jgi:hypothetical protein